MAQNKKIIISFILLFSVTAGLVLPQIANAVTAGTVIDIVSWATIGPVTNLLSTVFHLIFGKSVIKFTFEEITKLIMSLLAMIAGGIFTLSGKFLTFIISEPALKFDITKDAMVLLGWNVVRSFANMVIVLGFVVVAIATILRIREYEAARLLPLLIVAAILINFSLVICGLAIDAANVTMNYFLDAKGSGNVVTYFTDALTGEGMEKQLELANKKDPAEYAATTLGLSLSLIVTAMIFLLYGLIFLMRPVALMFLVILSPLSFACFALPITRSVFFNKWRDQFINWVIIGIPTAFFLYLGANLASSGPQFQNPIVKFWLVAAFLLVGYSFVFQSGAMGANAVIGLAGAGARWAMGTGLNVAKFAAKTGARAVADSDTGRKISSAGGRMLEAVYLRSKGTTAIGEAKSLGEARGKIKNLDAERHADDLARMALHGKTPEIRAAAGEKLAQGEQFSKKLTEDQQGRVIANSIKAGASSRIFEKNPGLGKHDIEAVDAETQKIIVAHPGTIPAVARQQAEQAVVRRIVQGRSSKEVGNFSLEALENPQVVKNLTHQQVGGLKNASSARISAVKKHLPAIEKQALAASGAGDVDELHRLNDLHVQISRLGRRV